MRIIPAICLALFLWPVALTCQNVSPPPYRIYGGATYFSNSYNGVPSAHSSLLGWDSAVEFPAWHAIRFKMDVSGTTGENGGASQRSFFVLGGAQFEHALGPERLFAHALVGDAGLTRYWGPDSNPGMTATFAVLLGGGIDTPVTRHFAIRLQGDMEHTNLDLVKSATIAIPYQSPGLPRFIARFSTGVIWTPRLGHPETESRPLSEPQDSDIIYEGESSFGHYRIYAASKWGYLHVAGFEYDRQSWGTFLRARLGYVAEILPVVILEQPAKADIWGNPTTRDQIINPGLGICPIGMRLLWRDGSRIQPFFLVKGGMIGFTHKSLSPYASYENFNLQEMTGFQVRLNNRFDMRVIGGYFHFSNGFLVPNNPGIDEMMYGGALVYHLHRSRVGAQ